MQMILLVEDNENIMDINEKYLTEQGYSVQCARSVREAEAVLFHLSPDLIVLDVMLPDGDGMDFCAKIRRTRSTPILFLTAKVTERDIVEGLERGGDDYLTKPYDLNVFGSRIRALLRRSGNTLPESQIYSIGPLRLDIIRAQAYVGGHDLGLSGKEFGLLLFLAQHRGGPVSKEEAVKAVWGVRDENGGTALWPIVSRLKRKLAPHEDIMYIDSDHNGYELIVTGTNEGAGT